MARYLMIASRDPLTAGDVDGFYALAGDLAAGDHAVTLFLVQNGVLPARGGPPDFVKFVETSDNTLVIPTSD